MTRETIEKSYLKITDYTEDGKADVVNMQLARNDIDYPWLRIQINGGFDIIPLGFGFCRTGKAFPPTSDTATAIETIRKLFPMDN